MRAEHRQAPRRAPAAGDGDDGLRVAAIRQRDRRLAERLRVILAAGTAIERPMTA